MISKYILVTLVAIGLAGCATLGLSSPEQSSEPTDVGEQSEPKEKPGDTPEVEEPGTFVLEGAPVASEPITFESHGEKLVGELVFPEAAPDSAEDRRRPGVVIVHDSGPHGRDGIMRGAFGIELPVEVAVYRSLAEALASRGFVVMIWDKRTCLEGGRPWCSYPRTHLDGHVDVLGDVLVDDLSSAFRTLKSSARTTDSIHIIGHGHGAEVALAAAEKLQPSSLVLAAPNTSPLDKMVLNQSERSIEALRARAAEVSNAETDAMVKQADTLEAQHEKLEVAFAAIRDGKDDEAAGLSAAAWRNLIELHERAQQVTYAPVMVVDAGMDLDVDDEERAALVARLQANGAEVVSVDELTRPLVSVADDGDPTVVSTEVALRIAKFLTEESR